MSEKEFQKRKKYLCKAPFSGLTINPTGSIVLCCSGGPVATPLGHISEVDSLQQFYNSEIMENVRSLHEKKAIDQSVCAGCYRQYAAGKHGMMSIFNNFWDWSRHNFDNDWRARKLGIDRPLRYLEYTCSNICNQTCASCSSWFSSKWRDYELAFTLDQQQHFKKPPNPILRLTETDIDKILDVLPRLDFLSMKGGEPWADKNNLKILEKVLEVNPSCTVDIISNMQTIPQSVWKILENVDHSQTSLWLSASIDGVGEEYNWIRGGNFNKTVENLERWHQITKKKIRINPVVTIFNFFSIDKIVDYFVSKPYVIGVNISNIATYPTYVKSQNLPGYIIAEQVEYYKTKFESYDQSKIYSKPLLNDIDEKITNLKELKKSFEWIEVVNKMRGFDLLDHVPELKRIKDVVCDD